jgi:hypothetical protein
MANVPPGYIGQALAFVANANVGIPSNCRMDVVTPASVTLTAQTRNGQSSAYTTSPGQTFYFDGRLFAHVASSAATAFYAIVPPDAIATFGSSGIAAISNPLPVSLPAANNGSSANPLYAIPTNGVGGFGVVSLGDNASQTAYALYLGGAAAPSSGIWHFAAIVTTNATNLSVTNGTFTELLQALNCVLSLLVTGTLYYYALPVVKGTTYTITAGTVETGYVSPA